MLEHHPRSILHFIPTSSSWLNQVERWFGELTQKAVRRGAFVSVAELQEVIKEFLLSLERGAQTVRVDSDGGKDNGQNGARAAATG
jgi:hypothetical protein